MFVQPLVDLSLWDSLNSSKLSKVLKNRIIFTYIFSELLPSFFAGVVTFEFILLMFQTLKFTEFILVHGASSSLVLKLISSLFVSLLPAILPMSLLFAVLLTYIRLSADSEIVAMKALGYSVKTITIPALVIALIVALFSAHSSFYLGPWGNRNFELLTNEIGSSKALATIKEGTFSEGFFDFVIYANKTNNKTGELEKVFIFDERDPKSPTTIIAKHGQIIGEKTRTEQTAMIRLIDGNIHKENEENHTRISFQSYDLKLFNPISVSGREKSMQSLTWDDLKDKINNSDSFENKKKFSMEKQKRISLAIACLLFALIGVSLGTQTNRRSGKSGGLTLSVGLIVLYWILFLASDGLAKNSSQYYNYFIWLPNFIFLMISIFSFRRIH